MLNMQKYFVKMVSGALSALMLTYALVPAVAFAAHRPPRHHYYQDRWTKHDTATVAGLAALIGLIALANKNKYRDRAAQFPEYSDHSGQVAPTFATQVLNLVNAERAKVGVRPLRLNAELQNAATIRAEEIRRHFAHERPDGSSCFTLLRDQNRWLGENIAAGSDTPEGVVDQWMHSPGHRANILNNKFSELGVGHYHADNTSYGHYWVQMFRG